MSKLIMMVGIPGSGKSYQAKLYQSKHTNTMIISSDTIREELYGDESILYNELQALKLIQQYHIHIEELTEEEKKEKMRIITNQYVIFPTLQSRIKEALKSGKDVVYDATNTKSRNRISVLKQLSPYYSEAIAIVVNTPLGLALKRNQERSRHVKEDIIRSYYQSFELPTKKEGFTSIQIIEKRKIQYEAIFLDQDSITTIHQIEEKYNTLINQKMYTPKDYHITTIYQPKRLNTSLYGKKVKMHVYGYIEDKEVKNPNNAFTSISRGLIIDHIESDCDQLNEMINHIDRLWHITLSYSNKAVDTNYVDLNKMIPIDLELTGTFGGFDLIHKQVLFKECQ